MALPTYSFGNRLNAETWTKEALGPTGADHYRSKEVREPTYFDLSALGYADFTSLARVLTWIVAARRSGEDVRVVLPRPDILPNEAASLRIARSIDRDSVGPLAQRIARARRQREGCRLFLEQAGFVDCLRTGPLMEVALDSLSESLLAEEISVPKEDDAPFNGVTISEEDSRPPRRNRRLVPYHWIRMCAGDTDRGVATLAQELADGLGLARGDANDIADGVIDELLSNVRTYGASPGNDIYALLGATYAIPPSFVDRAHDFPPPIHSLVHWAGESSQPLIRLVVADLGPGIGDRDHETQSGPVSDGESQRSAILHAFERHAGPGGATGFEGLWRVREMTRAFHGAVTISSGQTTAGYVFTSDEAGSTVDQDLAVPIRGTVVECTLVAPGQGASPALPNEDVLLPIRQRSTTSKPLPCVVITVTDASEVQEYVRARIGDSLDHWRREPAPSGVVIAIEVLTNLTADAHRTLVETAIYTATGILGAGRFSILICGLSRRLLDIAVAEINNPAIVTNSTAPPVLVTTSGGIHYWVGGSQMLRHALTMLSTSNDRRAITELAGDVENVDSVARALRNSAGLASVDEPYASLNRGPGDIEASLARHLQKMIGEACESATPGVRKGVFRTPSLRLTSRWIVVRDLLQALGITRLAGHALGATANTQLLSSLARNQGLVIHHQTVPRGLTGEFARALFVKATTLEMSESEEALEDKSWAITPRIVLVDLVSTGGSVRRIIRSLRRAGMDIAAVATVIDARKPDDQHRRPSEIVVDNDIYPLISLVQVRIEIDDPSKDEEAVITHIDPMTGMPLRHPAYAKASLEQVVYTEALSRVDAIRLGHIRRPAARHYTAYVDPTRLFEDVDWEREALDRMARLIEADSRKWNCTRCIVLFPDRTDDDLTRVVDALTTSLQRRGIECERPLQVPRVSAGREWVLPREISLPPNVDHVVILDSSSGSGNTIRQLIRLSAQGHVSTISAILLLNGMPEHVGLSMQQVRSVARTDKVGLSSSRLAEIQTRLYFLARTGVTPFESEQCSVCRLRREYAELGDGLPHPLAEWRATLLDTLRPRPKREVFLERPTDLFGLTISADDCIRYLDWRWKLTLSGHRTDSRNGLVQDIQRLRLALRGRPTPSDVLERNALLRVLAAEADWLRRAPLNMTSSRQMLADIALTVLLGPPELKPDETLRVQALTLLARSAGHTFTQEFPNVVRQNSDHYSVQYHALLEAMVRLRATSRRADDYDALVKQIEALEIESRALHPSSNGWAGGPARELIYYLYGRFRPTRIRPPSTRQEAWAASQRFCREVLDHKYDQALWRVQSHLHYLAKGHPLRSSASVMRDWEIFEAPLGDMVLPGLPMLADTIRMNRYRSAGDSVDHDLWEKFLEGQGGTFLNGIRDRLRLARSDAFDSTSFADLQTDLDALKRIFIVRDEGDSVETRRSILAKTIDGCPAPLKRMLEETFDRAEIAYRGTTDNDMLFVFVGEELLSDALLHLRRNAEATHAIPGASQHFFVEVSEGSATVDILVSNSGSRASNVSGGNGLRSLAVRLHTFGSALQVAQPEPGFTFAVKLSVQRWRS